MNDLHEGETRRLADAAELDAAHARARTRHRRVLLTGATSLTAKAVTLATAIISVPLTFRFLGAERYGLWMTLTSSVLFLGFADFGVGNGLTASIAEAHGRDDHGLAKRQISSAFFFLSMLALVVVVGFVLLQRFVNWGHLYGVHTSLATHEAGCATAVLLVCTALSMPLGVVQRVQLGFQQGYASDIWTAAGNALALAGILFTVHHGGSLPLLVAVVAGMPVMAMMANWIIQFFFVRPELRPRLSSFEWTSARRLAAVGGLFFLQQCFGLIYYLSDNLVIAHSMGATEVARFAVMQRIFSLGIVTQYLVAPLWPAVGEAIARRDFTWAARIARRSMSLCLLLSIGLAVPLLLLSRTLALRWSGIDPGPIDALRIGFALWVVLVGYIATANALLNQPAVMRRHLVLFGTASIASLLLKIVAAHYGSLAGVVWGTVIAFSTIYVVPAAMLALRSLSPQTPTSSSQIHVAPLTAGDAA
jgi:O-antigen/teichoic acid export membrane protein